MLAEADLEREFHKYRTSREKHLIKFNLDAIHYGFKKAWIERDYRAIIDVARKLPEEVLQRDIKLLMYYDHSRTRLYR